MQVEVRHLRAFVAVAEELNFTRAAARLHLAQQALSSQIQQLEQRMDARLFLRTSRRVELTPAGHALLAQAPGLLSALDGAVESARQAARGEAGNLTVGLLATAALDLTPQTLRAFAADRPQVTVSLRNVSFDEPTGGVATGEADVALVWLPFSTEGLAIEALAVTRSDPGESLRRLPDFDFLDPPEDPTHLGSIDRFQMVELVGRGGMGLVFRAYDACLQRTVAVKLLDPLYAKNELARNRFIREARAALARLMASAPVATVLSLRVAA